MLRVRRKSNLHENAAACLVIYTHVTVPVVVTRLSASAGSAHNGSVNVEPRISLLRPRAHHMTALGRPAKRQAQPITLTAERAADGKRWA